MRKVRILFKTRLIFPRINGPDMSSRNMYKNGRHELLNEVEETAGVVYKDILDLIQQKLHWTVLDLVYTNQD